MRKFDVPFRSYLVLPIILVSACSPLLMSRSATAQPTVAEGVIGAVSDSITVSDSVGVITVNIDPESLPVMLGDPWRISFEIGTAAELVSETDFSSIPGLSGAGATYSVTGTATVTLGENTYTAGIDTLQITNDFANEEISPDPRDGWAIIFRLPNDFGCSQFIFSVAAENDTLFDSTAFANTFDIEKISLGALTSSLDLLDRGTGTCVMTFASVFSGAANVFGTYFDVLADYWASSFIRTLAASHITSGCGNNNYCPGNPVTRAQMAVFLERGMRGSGFSPPAATGNLFLDVAANDFAANFIEQLFLDGITAGCGNNNYCPDASVTRAQMAVFLLRARHGAGYSPPPATGVFGDVDLSHWAGAWIEQLAAEGITAGCGNGDYCPDNPVTRDQMAVFLVRTFGL